MPLPEAEELELETRGRVTGRLHRVRLWFALEDDLLWLRGDADADWLRNLRAHPDCIVRLASKSRPARYEPVAGDANEALRHLVALWRQKYGSEWVQDWWYERGREPVAVRILGPGVR